MGSKGEDNRQRIVNAADELFYRRGFSQTSFQDISDATGIPRGNFYYYFKTKDDILDAVIDSRIADLKTMLSQCESETDNPRQRLLLFSQKLEFKQDDIMESGCPIGSLSSELAKNSVGLHDKSRQVFSLLRDWIKQQLDSQGVAASADLAMDLLARLQGMSVMACAFKDEDYIRRSHQQIKDWISEITEK